MNRIVVAIHTRMIIIALVMAASLVMPPPVHSEMSEVETFVRARIEIGESMGIFMRERGGMERTREQYEKMTEEINAMVERILQSYGLTTEEFRERSPEIYADETAIETFLERHPELKARYERLPFSQGPRGPGRP